MSPKESINGPEYQEFLAVLQSNKDRIFGYILASILEYSVAEDIMQDTIIRLWTKFSDYTPGTNFAKWGITFARFVILDYQRKRRTRIVRFDSQILEDLSEPFESDESSDDRIDALRECLRKLPEKYRHIIKMRYSDDMTIKDIAIKIGRPIHGMYKAMTKVQYSLQECIEGLLRRRDGYGYD